jgi:hypothetical protein
MLYIPVAGDCVLDVTWIEDGKPILSGCVQQLEAYAAVLTAGAIHALQQIQLSALVIFPFARL